MLPDGSRSPHTRVPVGHTTAHDIATYDCPVGSYVVPVFAVRKPKAAPAVSGERYACWAGVCMWLTDGEDDPRDTGTRAEAEARAAGIPGAKVVRILNDGAHEAAVAAAHKRGRAEAFATAAKVVRDTHDDLDERNESISMGLLANIADAIEELVRKEAAKGCAE